MEQAKLFINNYKFNDNRTYTWRKEWIAPYESPWSILEKFKYINSLSDKDIFRIFGTQITKQKKTISLMDRDLIKMDSLDSQALTSILGVDIKKANEENIEKVISLFINSKKFKRLNSYIRPNVHYCPECAKYGFHSIWNQIELIELCPYHKLELFSTCPRCSKEIPYNIYNSNLKKPFLCQCNQSISNERVDPTFFKKWNNALKFDIVDDNINFILNLSAKQTGLLKRIYFDDDYVQSWRYRLLGHILPILGKPQNSESEYHHYKMIKKVCRKNIGDYININSVLIKDNSELYNVDLLKSLRGVYKSLAKDIRRKLLFKHMACIRDLVKNGYSKEISLETTCSFAYSYLMWKKDIEGEMDFSNIDNGRKICRKSCELDMISQNLFWNKFISNIESLKQMFAYESKHINDYSSYKWLLERIVGVVLHYHFFNLMSQSKFLIDKGERQYVFDSKNQNLPFFLVIFPESIEGEYEIHWWVTKEFDKNSILNNMKCPVIQ